MPLLRANCGFDSRRGYQKVLDFQGLFDLSLAFSSADGRTLPKLNLCFVFSKISFLGLFPANKISRNFTVFAPLLITLLISLPCFFHSLANRQRRTTRVQPFLFYHIKIKKINVFYRLILCVKKRNTAFF